MADALFILITVAFFAIAVGFVKVCDRVIGPDDEHGPLSELGEADPTTPGVAEPTEPTLIAGSAR